MLLHAAKKIACVFEDLWEGLERSSAVEHEVRTAKGDGVSLALRTIGEVQIHMNVVFELLLQRSTRSRTARAQSGNGFSNQGSMIRPHSDRDRRPCTRWATNRGWSRPAFQWSLVRI